MHRAATSLLLLLAVSLLASCADYRARENLRRGLLVLELSQADFLDIWDAPTHTSAISGDEIIKSGIAGWGGFFFKGREMYEMWEYENRQTRLVFYQQRLVAWKTALPVQKLAVPPPDYVVGDGPRPLPVEAPVTVVPPIPDAPAPARADPAPQPAEAPPAATEPAAGS